MDTFESLLRQIVREEVRAALTEIGAERESAHHSASSVEAAPLALSPAQVTERTGMAAQTLANWRGMTRRGVVVGPPFFKLGRLIRYDPDELDAWLAKHRVEKS